jgi:hypothetical protein
MKENPLNFSGKIDNPTIAMFDCIAHVADSLNIPFFVVGAAARDIILRYSALFIEKN